MRAELRTVAAPGALLLRLCHDGRVYSGVSLFGQLDPRATHGGTREELRLIQSDLRTIDPAAPAAFVVDPDGTLHGGPRNITHQLTSDGRVLGPGGAIVISVAPDGVVVFGSNPSGYRAVPATPEGRRYSALLAFVMLSLHQ